MQLSATSLPCMECGLWLMSGSAAGCRQPMDGGRAPQLLGRAENSRKGEHLSHLRESVGFVVVLYVWRQRR